MIKSVFNIIISFYVFTSSLWAQQNLVPNGSFEEYYQCPSAVGSLGDNQLERCKYWYKPNDCTTDYYNSCQTNPSSGVCVPNNWFGWQQPFDGNAYIGLGIYVDIVSSGAEYVQVKLLTPLESCKKYQVRFWTSLGDFCSLATSTLGARLDVQPIKQLPPYNLMGFELPAHIGSNQFVTDTSEWVLVSGIYEASGGEQYLTLGRFLDTTLYSNFDVPNIPVLCDSCFIGENTAHYFIDSVSIVELINENSPESQLPNIFTPNSDLLNDYWYPIGICFEDWNCEIYNRWGNMVFNFIEDSNGWSGSKFDGSELSEGIYYYRVFNQKENETGFIQLIR